MRTIKFKAKSKCTGEWITGDLVHDKSGKYTFIRHVGIVGGHPDHINEEINPDTICQFTGMYAEGHKEIYENDIVEAFYYNEAFGVDMTCRGIVKWIDWGYFLEPLGEYKYKHKDCEALNLPYSGDDTESLIRIIRNKYDNS